MAVRTQRLVGRWTWAVVALLLLTLVAPSDGRTQGAKRHRHRGHATHQRAHAKHQRHAAHAKHHRHHHRVHKRHHAHRGPSYAGLHPAVRTRLAAAFSELRRHGVRPRVTSAYRSSSQQRQLYRCAQSRKCRLRRGVYGARPPGRSTHEAGLAVDIAGIASHGPGRRRRLTSSGATIVRVMRRHQFAWRYGLRDPAHFELSPKRVGFRSTPVAIAAHRSGRVVATRARPSRAVTVRPANGRYRARVPRPWLSPRA